MKKFFLLLLMGCIFLHSSSQIDLDKPAKWTITANNLKTSTGRLLMANPPGSKWTIYIYTSADNKYVTSFNQTNNKGLFILQPGEYKITLNDAPVENVVIKKGHDTKLKTGILDIPNNEVWYLYDETGKNYHSSGNKPEKLVMPAGNYLLDIDGSKRQVLVKEQEPDQTPDKLSIDAEKYTMTPLPENRSIKNENNPGKGKGLLWLLPGHQGFAYPMYLKIKAIKMNPSGGDSLIFECSYKLPGSQHCWENVSLPVGDYKILIDVHRATPPSGLSCAVVGSELVLNNIPVRNGYETRLKYGYLKVNNPGVYQTGYHYFLASGKIPYPVGKYQIKHFFVGDFPVEIKDGETADLQTMDPATIPNPKWETRFWLSKDPSKAKMGRFNCSFPPPADPYVIYTFDKLVLLTPKPNAPSEYTYTNLDTLKFIDLEEGRYRLNLNGVFEEIVIEAKKETRLRFGYFKLKIPEGQSWSLIPLNAANTSSAGGTRSKTIAVPVGYYKLRAGILEFLVKIDDGETREVNYSGIFCF